ncbi:vesicle transport protein [Vairimorpha necatrix]|uniref:Protein transport protein SFT2 n=1 Tax=Vairimorpha necatrix TaxID=6039 RepID=A0AAX4JAB8_9MICR
MDPLQEASKIKEKQIFFTIPPRYEQIFKQKEYDLEYFGLTLMQRVMAFVVFFAIGLLSFLYAMMKVPAAVFYPASFAFPYALSNFIFFFMFGFILGFRSYLSNLFSEKKRMYTSFFIFSTIATIYSTLTVGRYFINFFFCLVQMSSFIVFALTFIPGGTHGISSMMSLVLKK